MMSPNSRRQRTSYTLDPYSAAEVYYGAEEALKRQTQSRGRIVSSVSLKQMFSARRDDQPIDFREYRFPDLSIVMT